MNADAELIAWRRQWQSRAEPPRVADLKARVMRETRHLKFWLAIPVLVTLGIGGGVLYRARESNDQGSLDTAIQTWIFIAVVWTISLWLARGTWRPDANTTAAFVDLGIRRCRSYLMAVPIAAILYLAQLSWLLVQAIHVRGVPAAVILTSSAMILTGWFGGPVLTAFLWWFYRRKRKELEYLLDVKRQLSEAL